MPTSTQSVKTIEQYMEEGDRIFSILSHPDNPVRRMSEASRDIDHGDDSETFLEVAARGMETAVKDFEHVVKMFKERGGV